MPALNKLQLLVSQFPIEFAIAYGFGDVLGSDVFGVGQVGSTAALTIGDVISEMAVEHFALPDQTNLNQRTSLAFLYALLVILIKCIIINTLHYPILNGTL